MAKVSNYKKQELRKKNQDIRVKIQEPRYKGNLENRRCYCGTTVSIALPFRVGNKEPRIRSQEHRK